MTDASAMTKEQALAALRWLLAAGADEALDEMPADRFSAPAAGRPEPLPAVPRGMPAAAAVPQDVPASQGQIGSVSEAQAAASAAADLDALRAAIAGFRGGQFQKTAKSLVFADGNPNADLMLIGEAPGAEEDRVGKPFVGPSGQLLDRMLAAIGRTRADSAYITNIIPWRPLGNRTPDTELVSAFMPFVWRHVALVRPRIVVALGGVAGKALAETEVGITRLRGRWTAIAGDRLGTGHDTALMPTYHPAYLLRNPAAKAQAWQDLLSIEERLLSPTDPT